MVECEEKDEIISREELKITKGKGETTGWCVFMQQKFSILFFLFYLLYFSWNFEDSESRHLCRFLLRIFGPIYCGYLRNIHLLIYPFKGRYIG